jgi:hypothetical protein
LRSGSFERGDQPRSVSDPDREAYEHMMRGHRALLAQMEHGSSSEHPRPHGDPIPERRPNSALDHVAAGIAHVLNEPREARRQFEQHHYGRALIDGATAAADLTLGRSIVKGIAKRQFKLLPPYSWRTKPWEAGQGVRKWMTEKGIAAKGEDVHHGIIPNNGWGKRVPDAVKNQPFNAKPMEDKLTHVRIHGNSRQTGLPRFNAVERYHHGAPTWWKAAHASGIGHLIEAGLDHRGHPGPSNTSRAHHPKTK